MTKKLFLVLLVALILAPIAAAAGPVEDLLESVAPGLTGFAWWGELVAAIVAAASLFAAATPKGDSANPVWSRARAIVNWLAANVGNARNEGE